MQLCDPPEATSTLVDVGLYKSAGTVVNEIPGDELTATLIREGKPAGLFKEIERLGGTVKESAKGVYQVTGIIHMPVQVVVSRELEGDAFAGLRVLSRKPTEEDIRIFVSQAKEFEKPGDKQDADAVLQVSISTNERLYEELKRRDPTMCDALMTLMKPEMEAEIDRRIQSMQAESDKRIQSMRAESDKREETSTLKKIKNLMRNFNVTAQQAMEGMGLTAKEQAKYLSML